MHYQYIIAFSLFLNLSCVSLLHAQRSTFAEEVYASNQRALAWIKVNTSAGNFGGVYTPLGGLAILAKKLNVDPQSPAQGYRYAPPSDQAILRQMVNYTIDQNVALLTGSGGENVHTSTALIFLSFYTLSGGPSFIGARTSVNQALQNGVLSFKI